VDSGVREGAVVALNDLNGAKVKFQTFFFLLLITNTLFDALLFSINYPPLRNLQARGIGSGARPDTIAY